MSTKSQTHHYEAFMCKKTAAEEVFSSAFLFLPCCSKWKNYLDTFPSFFKQQNLSSLKEIFCFSCLSPTNIYTNYLLSRTFRNVFNFPPALSTSANLLLFDPSPLVSSASSFIAWRRSWHPGRHVKPWRTGGNKPENSSNLQESSPFTLTPVVLCPLIQPWR